MAQTRLQLTLAVIKPHVVVQPPRLQEIREAILGQKFYVIRSKMICMNTTRAEQFYREHEGRHFYRKLVNYITSGPICAHILARENGISEWRNLMGPTKVFRGIHQKPDCLRSVYGLTDVRNATHGADSETSAKREISFLFPEFDMEEWYREQEILFRQHSVTFDPELFQHNLQTGVKALY